MHQTEDTTDLLGMECPVDAMNAMNRHGCHVITMNLSHMSRAVQPTEAALTGCVAVDPWDSCCTMII